MFLRLLALLTGFLLYGFQTLAQAYEPGLLVRSNGDTLRGEIENAFWTEPPTFIHFRPTADSPSELFQPRQLRAVSFTNGRYFRYQSLPIDHAATTQLSQLAVGVQADVQVDSLLAEVLLDGPMTLWRVVRPGSTHYLLSRPGHPILDLCERRYLRQNPAGGQQLVDGNNYRSQLKIYFGDCPAAAAAAETAAFTTAGVAAVVQAYCETCEPSQPPMCSWLAVAKPRHRMAFQGGLLAGVRYTYVKDPSDKLPETQPCTDCQVRPFVGLYADLLQPNRTTALYGELSLSTFRNQYWGYFQTNADLRYYVVDYRGWLATARLGLRFFFPLPHEQQWLLSVSYELNKVLNPTIISNRGNLGAPPEDQLGYASPTLLPGLGLGWRSQRLTLGLDGQLYTNANVGGFLSYFTGSNFAVRASLGYRLGRNPDAAKTKPTSGR